MTTHPPEWLEALEDLNRKQLVRSLKPLSTGSAASVERFGRTMLNFASNDYLGLAKDPRVAASASDAIQHWGVGAGASPLLSGWTELHAELAEELAAEKRAPAVALFPSGFAANLGVLTALAGPRDSVLCDALVHASLIDGCRAAHAKMRFFRHRDLTHLEELLKTTSTRGARFVLVDGVFSMDGELAPLPELASLSERWGATLIVDDAHGTGVVGADGRGTVSHFGLESRVPVLVGTLSKALGAQGGFVAGSRVLIDLLVNRARSLIYSTALAPPLVAAALSALRIARQEGFRRKTLKAHGARMRDGLRRLGWRVVGDTEAPMLAAVVGTPETALALSAHLEQRGLLAPAIRPPTVPAGTSRVRLSPMATHQEEHIDQVLAAFAGADPPR